jgi:hypothetical protein
MNRLRCGDRRQRLTEKEGADEIGPFAQAVADRAITILAFKIDDSTRGRERDVDAGVFASELVKPRQQPALGEATDGADA